MANIFLTAGDKLQVLTSATCTVDVMVFAEGGRQGTKIIAAATTDVFVPGGPATVETLLITNTHVSDPVTVTPIMVAGGVSFALKGPAILGPGQALSYTQNTGFVVPSSLLLNSTKYVTADSVHATAATFVAMTGLTFPVLAAHVYTFELQLFHVADATTTGAQFGVGGVAATFLTVGSMSVVTAGVATTTMSSGVATAVDTAVIVQTTSSTAATVPTYVAGTIQPSASGTLEFRATSEVTVAAGLTVKKGSWANVRETDN